MDEFLVFAGASYFRAIARGQVFGLSARGPVDRHREQEGEEFPFFRAFWLERPGDGRMVVHALLDGPSASGAFRFTIRPGERDRDRRRGDRLRPGRRSRRSASRR